MPRNRPQETHCDIGLNPEADRTEDLRPAKSEAPEVAASEASEPLPNKKVGSTMIAHTTDGAEQWRDLADQLRPEQVDYLEHWDANPIPGIDPADGRHDQATLRTAREFIDANAAAVRFAHIAPPPEEGHHYPWIDQHDGTWTRGFVGTTREAGGATVSIGGIQDSNGTIDRSIHVDECEELDPQSARQLAAALIEAADEIDRLSPPDVDTSRNW